MVFFGFLSFYLPPILYLGMDYGIIVSVASSVVPITFATIADIRSYETKHYDEVGVTLYWIIIYFFWILLYIYLWNNFDNSNEGYEIGGMLYLLHFFIPPFSPYVRDFFLGGKAYYAYRRVVFYFLFAMYLPYLVKARVFRFFGIRSESRKAKSQTKTETNQERAERQRKQSHQNHQRSSNQQRQQNAGRDKQGSSSYEKQSPDSATSSDRKEALEVLGLTDPFTQAELKKKRGDLLKKNHPDLGGSAVLTRVINWAYDTLKE